MVIEDILPMSNTSNIVNSINDRHTLANYVKNTLLNNENGILVERPNSGIKDFFKRIKTTKLNPYAMTLYRSKNNPYKLPHNFIIYQSCYPIKNTQMGISCAFDSVGMNMRLYRITIGESKNKHDDNVIYNSDSWREMKFYEYINSNILQQKISPNFVMLYGYNLYKDPEINFDEFNKLTSEKQQRLQPLEVIKYGVRDDHSTFVNVLRYYKQHNLNFEDTIKKFIVRYLALHTDWNNDELKRQALKEFLDEELTKHTNIQKVQNIDNIYKDDLIVALTESPTYTIYKWASKEYINNGVVKTMSSSGYHTEYEWCSLIFQLLTAFHCLIQHNIYIPTFSITSNILIKEIKHIPSNPKIWKYVINGIDYYVPNFGALVLIDSDNKDKLPSEKYKIYGRFDPKSTSDLSEYRTKMIDLLIECLNPTNFNNNIFLENNGTPIDSIISGRLSQIYNHCNNNKTDHNIFVNCIINFIPEFLNNRIGTIISDEEFKMLTGNNAQFEFSPIDNPKSGNILLHKQEDLQTGTSQYQFVQFVKSTGAQSEVFGSKGKLSNIDNSGLFNVPSNFQIKQIMTQTNGSREPSDILDIYNINLIN